MISGKWIYRSFHNKTDRVNYDPQKAVKLLFGEGELAFVSQESNRWSATLNGEGWGMDLTGFIEDRGLVDGLILHGTGVGRDNTSTAGWVYEYRGLVLSQWPAGVDEIPSMVGSVIRTVRHGSEAAGKVASFIAVKIEN
ncbi:hypothetical protein CBR59_24325 [Bacillus thuringiensis]|uniref:hypothetical protein n=1 Tax=Bacillus cereus group TaxID=86661 RepID=UPI000C9DE8FC|nr:MULTISPECIES: hypothetical protein [Bacillus cereus group]PNK24696.1 hypothetical protein CBP87_25820 [Bacillus thuringiensis]PNK52012.1 hypothetical protein CBR59_24325 [Bacillus thuringiensis]TFZ14002.1 hypothetical protein C6Y54_04865 [Bacillus cereus]